MSKKDNYKDEAAERARVVQEIIDRKFPKVFARQKRAFAHKQKILKKFEPLVQQTRKLKNRSKNLKNDYGHDYNQFVP